MFIDQLQAVPVACNDHTFPIVIAADFTDSTNHVISFPTLASIDGNIHRFKNLFHNRHLLCKFFRHTMSGSFITIVFQMTERRSMQVECNTNCLRLFFLFHLFQNIQKAVNGIGVKPLTSCKGLYTIKCTINDGVTVKDHKLHTFLHLVP